MKVLIVATSIPFPPRQGVELPTARIAEALAGGCTVDLLVIARSEEDVRDFAQRKTQVPDGIGQVKMIRATDHRSFARKLLGEVVLRQPAFFINGFAADDLRRLCDESDYDVAWFSPVGCLGLKSACDRLGLRLAAKVAVGCNDVVTTTYLDSLKEWLSGRIGFSLQRLIQGLRTGLIAWHEKRYLRGVDVLHVQTELEKQRAHWLLGKQRSQPKVIAAQNGRGSALMSVTYQATDAVHQEAPRVLYMTHLQGGRAQESRWFLTRVWPMVVARYPAVKLLLAGTPPADDAITRQLATNNIQVLGYVDDLVELYSSVTLAVVPIVHSTGLINRALDALTAGVPLVSTAAVLSTVAGCQPGRDAIAAESATDFAAAVGDLLGDLEKRQSLSHHARQLAMKQPTWQETADTIRQALLSVVVPMHRLEGDDIKLVDSVAVSEEKGEFERHRAVDAAV